MIYSQYSKALLRYYIGEAHLLLIMGIVYKNNYKNISIIRNFINKDKPYEYYRIIDKIREECLQYGLSQINTENYLNTIFKK